MGLTAGGKLPSKGCPPVVRNSLRYFDAEGSSGWLRMNLNPSG